LAGEHQQLNLTTPDTAPTEDEPTEKPKEKPPTSAPPPSTTVAPSIPNNGA